jgi:hypothetical protein
MSQTRRYSGIYLINSASESNIDKNISGLNSGLDIFPNPAKNIVNIRYDIANDGIVKFHSLICWEKK